MISLVACGAPSGVAPVAPGSPSPAPGPSPAPLPVEGRVDALSRQVLDRMAARVQVTRTWRARVVSELLEPSGDLDHLVYDVAYARPGFLSSEVLEARNRGLVGSHFVFDGKNRVDLETRLFGWIPLRFSLPCTDSRLLDARGRSIRDNSTESLITLLLDPATSVVHRGERAFDGDMLDLLEVRGTKSGPAIDHELVGVSRSLHVPRSRHGLDARGRRILRMELHGMLLNPVLPPDTFTIR